MNSSHVVWFSHYVERLSELFSISDSTNPCFNAALAAAHPTGFRTVPATTGTNGSEAQYCHCFAVYLLQGALFDHHRQVEGKLWRIRLWMANALRISIDCSQPAKKLRLKAKEKSSGHRK